MILVEFNSGAGPVVVNMDRVQYFSPDALERDGTYIYYYDGYKIWVQESFDKVMDMAEEMECSRERRIRNGLSE